MSSEEQESSNPEQLQRSRKTFSKKPKGLEVKLAEARLEIIMNNNYHRAQQILDEIISQDARYQRAFIMYGNLQRQQGNYDKAIHHFIIANKIKTSPKLWKKIAFLEKKQAQKCEQCTSHESTLYHYYQAAKYLGKLLRQRNKEPNIYLMQERVECLEKCFEYEKGIKQLQVLVDLAINLQQTHLHQESIKRMARLYVKKNQLEDAKQVLRSLPLNDKSTIMICEILEKEQNFTEMRETLDNYFQSKSMRTILKEHNYKLISFYIQCLQQSFTDYQQVIDFYINNQDSELVFKNLIDLTDKLEPNSKQQLLQVLYNYRDQLNQKLKTDILTKYNNYNFDNQLVIEEPQLPIQPNTKDQIMYLYKKLKQTSNVDEKYDFLRKILCQEEKSFNKLRYFDGIKREEYEQLFGKKHKKRRLRKFHALDNQLRKKTTCLSTEIGYENFFETILDVFGSLLDNNKSSELFKLTHNVYQLRLKKIAKNNSVECDQFVQKLAQYGLWASLKERKYRYAPVYLRYLKEEKLTLFLIQIIDQNVSTNLRVIFNSFTRGLPFYQQSVIPYKLNQLLLLREEDPKNAVYNLLICVKYLQEMTGRLAIDQEELFKKSLYYFDCYKDCQPDQLEVRYNLARIYLHINVVNKGMEILEQILECESEHPVKSKAGFALMQLHKKLGNQDRAFYYLRKYNTFH